MLMYPGMTVMDLIGPQSMFAAIMGAKIHIVAKSLDPVTSDAGVSIMPDATFDTCPRDLTILFTPGSADVTIKAATDPAPLAFKADRGRRATYVTSLCSGARWSSERQGCSRAIGPPPTGHAGTRWQGSERSRQRPASSGTATGSPARA